MPDGPVNQDRPETRLPWLSDFNEFDVEVELLSRQWMITVDSDRILCDRCDDKPYRLTVLPLRL